MAAVCVGCGGGSRKAGAPSADDQLPTQAEHPLPPPRLARSYKDVEIRQTASDVRNVFVDGTNITNFPNPHHIYTAEVSPSGRYLLVWHMDFSPRKVSVFDLDSGERVSQFVPGAGGEVRWAAHDLIYHCFGAGTNTAFPGIYSVTGEMCWGASTSGAALDASGLYVLVLPSLPNAGEHILIADVRTGDALGRARPDDFDHCQTYTWLDGRTIRVWYRTLDRRTRCVDIPIDPDHPEAWTYPKAM